MSIIVLYGAVLMAVAGVGTADELSQGGSAVLFHNNDTNDTTKGTAWNNLSENTQDYSMRCLLFI